MKDILRLLRVKQYSKNLFVLAALLFTRGFSKPELVAISFEAVLVMCLLGSATYIVNDVFDAERDRAHPKKRHRPIASGAIKPKVALAISGFLGVVGLALAWLMGTGVLYCGLFYLGLQVIYNLGLKRVPIADVFVIATGFVLRVVIGAVAIQVQLSGWILLCTGALALLLGFGKRRSEYVTQELERSKSRESLAGYSLPALDALVICSAAVAVLCYGLYGIQSPTAKLYPGLIITIPFVAFGIFRYMVLIFGNEETDEPESLILKDKPLILAFILFVVSSAVALAGLNLPLIN